MQIIASLRSNGIDEDLIASLIASNRRSSSGDVNVTVPDSGMDNKTLAALVAALAGNNGDGSGQAAPGTNVYNPGMSGQELAELIRYLGINELEPVTGNPLDAIETALKVADFILSHSSAQPANTGAASITEPPVYQAAQSPVPKYLTLYLIIGLIVTIIGFIIVRIIPESREAKDNADT